MDDWRIFGDELRRLRLRSGKSLRALGCAVNYDPGALSRIQSGQRKPTFGLAVALDRELAAGGSLTDLAAELLHLDPPGGGILSEKAPPAPSEIIDMNRRALLRLLNIVGAFFAVPTAAALDWERLRDPRVDAATIAQYAVVNMVLWKTYSSSLTKATVFPAVREQLTVLVDGLRGHPHESAERRRLSELLAELLQLAGEILFDSNRYTLAAQCYTLAATASREARAFDLWACSLTRHSFIAIHDENPNDSATILEFAGSLAARGDSTLSTRHWVSTVHAQTLAALGDSEGCRRELDEATKVHQLRGQIHNGGWLRFDGSRLAEERGNCYLQLKKPDLAEQALTTALGQNLSARRRGAVLTDLARVGALRRDPVELVMYGDAALDVVRRTRSGYVGHKLCGLQAQLGPFLDDRHVRRLDQQITALTPTRRRGTES